MKIEKTKKFDVLSEAADTLKQNFGTPSGDYDFSRCDPHVQEVLELFSQVPVGGEKPCKYKQALIDLYRSCVENRPSFPEHLEISEYNRAVSIFEDERTKSINHAIALGAKLVEGGKS